MEKKAHHIDSLKELQGRVPSIVQAINADQKLAVRAAANPILAIEELGFTIAEALRPTVERRIRFSIATAERLETLAEEVYKIVGHRFNIDSPSALAQVLFEELRLPRPERGMSEPYAAKKPPATGVELATALLPYQVKQAPKVKDPLEELRGRHPVMEPLLDYRRLEASSPHLAPPELYQKIRRGEVELPIKRLRARLQRSSTPE